MNYLIHPEINRLYQTKLWIDALYVPSAIVPHIVSSLHCYKRLASSEAENQSTMKKAYVHSENPSEKVVLENHVEVHQKTTDFEVWII